MSMLCALYSWFLRLVLGKVTMQLWKKTDRVSANTTADENTELLQPAVDQWSHSKLCLLDVLRV